MENEKTEIISAKYITAETDHMAYQPGMDNIGSEIQDEVISRMNAYDADAYTAADVLRALRKDVLSPEDFAALLSPAALPFLEQMAQRAQMETRKHFGNSVQMFTPLYIANYCENYCIYCGFNCHNKIRRAKLDMDEIEQELKAIADTGLQEILLLTGESRAMSPVSYIGEAVKLARKYFRVIGIEIYPLNVDEYAYLHECGVDYVTVFQETYDDQKYKTLHLGGHKRIFPYRLNAQERAIMGGMRGVGFAALLGLSDFRKDAFATGLHAYLLQRKYPHAEIAFSCPRLRPIINNDKSIRRTSTSRSPAGRLRVPHLHALRLHHDLDARALVSAIISSASLRPRFPQAWTSASAGIPARRRATSSSRFRTAARSTRSITQSASTVSSPMADYLYV